MKEYKIRDKEMRQDIQGKVSL